MDDSKSKEFNSVDDLRRKIENVLDSRKKGVTQKNKSINELLEDINIYHQELEFQNEELMRIRRDLENSHAQLADLFNNAPIGYVTYNEENFIREANTAFAVIAGKTGGECRGRRITDFIHPESQDEFYFHTSKLLKTGQKQTCNLILKDFTGNNYHVKIESNLYRQGDYQFIRSAVIDMSREKEASKALTLSEEKFKKAFYTSPDSINISRLDDGLITAVNQGFTQLTGYTEEDAVGKTAGDLQLWYNSEDRSRLVDIIQNNGKAVNFESTFRLKDGKIRSGLLSASIIESGGEKHIISITRDITDIKNAAVEKDRLQAQLVQTQKMESVGRLAGGVAHDFNNMLQVIIGYADMSLEAAEADNPLYTNLLEIKKAALHSAELVSHLLAFARKQTVRPRVLDLNEAVSGMIKMLERLIGENIKLSWIPSEHPEKIKIDPSQVDQILANLAVNARDSIEKNGILVIETSECSVDADFCSNHSDCTPGRYVLLKISDNGCGMDKETLARCFEPFYTTKKLGEGTGLGLSTVYGIVMQNSGFITVYSEPGRGTSFNIYLPNYAEEEEDTMPPLEHRELTGGNETILLVEDEKLVLNLGKTILEKLGYNVLAAHSPSMAQKILNRYSGRIDLLITDIIMPEMDGKQLASELTSVQPDLKYLFMSGYSANVINRWGIIEEGISFIQKPFTVREMAHKVRNILDTTR